MATKANSTYRLVEPQEIFETAYSHLYFARHALKMYYQQRDRVPNIISPLATYSSLSLELFLKALLFQTTGEPTENEHNLENLWGKLGEDHKKALIELIGLPADDLSISLQHHRNMFSSVRYNYELDNVRYNISFLTNLAEIVGYYFLKVITEKGKPSPSVEFYFHSISQKGKLNRHSIEGNTQLYKTFPSIHNHYMQQSLQFRLEYLGGGQFGLSRF